VSLTVIEALRRFLPDHLASKPPLSSHQRRAIWALSHCRTPALGGQAFGCSPCRDIHFAWHSCNHKACPQCGRGATALWVARQLKRLLPVPYFLVTFTLPAQLRGEFFGPHAKQAYDLFFQAVAAALHEKLAEDNALRAHIHGFVAVLQTWNQKLGFHPHIHCLIPGAGLDRHGNFIQVKRADFLVYLPDLKAAFRQHFYRLLQKHIWHVDPTVWRLDWGIDILPAGSGATSVKYLGTYVASTAIKDQRLRRITDDSVSFRWKDRKNKTSGTVTLPGVEFVTRYLRHVLPKGLRSVRYYGFCHPAAKATRLRIQLLSGMSVEFGDDSIPKRKTPPPCCPHCNRPMHFLRRIPAPWSQRGPPGPVPPLPSRKAA